jgi:hypothetical protein
MDRRTFIRTGLTAAALPVVAPIAGDAQASRAAIFEFTGLVAFDLWRQSKKLQVLLIDAIAGGMKQQPHAPMLMVRYSDYDPANSTYIAPQLLWLGPSDPVAVWSLNGMAVWDGDAQQSYGQDNSASLTFNDGSLPFVDMGRLLKGGGTYAVPRTSYKFVSGQVMLTRGTATPRRPEAGSCEETVKYAFQDPGTSQTVIPSSSYASQLSLEYPVSGPSLKLKIAPSINGSPAQNNVATIAIRIPGSGKTYVNISNPALGIVQSTHFSVFYKLAGVRKGPVLTHSGTCRNRVPVARAERIPKAAHATEAPMPPGETEPPFIGCIPPVFTEN